MSYSFNFVICVWCDQASISLSNGVAVGFKKRKRVGNSSLPASDAASVAVVESKEDEP